MNDQLICRENYLDVQAYLAHCQKTKHNSPDTLKRKWGLLRHALEWSKSTPFSESPSRTDSFADYLDQVGTNGQLRSDDKTGPLSPETKRRTREELVRFFKYMAQIDPNRYKKTVFTDEWLAAFDIPLKQDCVKEHEFYTLAEVEKLTAPANQEETLTEFRIRAAIALLFISGMRIGALVTLPVKAIDLRATTPVIWQWARYGVETKNGKPITSYLLQIPSLLAIVQQWDALIRPQLSPDALWFADLTRDGMGLTGKTQAGRSRGDAVRKGLHSLCDRTGISYKHPHCLRHGHIIYTVKRAKDMKTLIAISQNVGHEDLTTTLQVYGKLTGDDVQESISNLTAVNASRSSLQAALDQIYKLLQDVEG